jgi:hypothetical protein
MHYRYQVSQLSEFHRWHHNERQAQAKNSALVSWTGGSEALVMNRTRVLLSFKYGS